MKSGALDIQGNILAGGLHQLISETLIAAADSYTKLLIHGNAIADATGKTATAVGTAAVTTAQYKFSSVGASIVLDGNSDYLTFADSTDWDLFGGDMTMDCFVRFNAVNQVSPFCAQYIDANNLWYFEYHPVYGLVVGEYVSGVGTYAYCGWSPSINTWYHVAVVKSGSSCYLFIDGVSQTLVAFTGWTNTSFASTLRVGYNQDTGLYLNGWLSEVRISKGIARWTANFTPPTVPYDGATTSLTISGLDGDTAQEYILICRFIAGAATTQYYLRPNNDSGNNYGRHYLTGDGSAVYGYRWTATNFMELGYALAANNLSFSETKFCAKSGYIRTALSTIARTVSGATVAEAIKFGQVWNNTADNITNLVIKSDTNNGISVGSHILLLAKRG